MNGRDVGSQFCILDLELDIPYRHGAEEEYIQSESVGLIACPKGGPKV